MTDEGVTESLISHLLSCLYGYDDSGGRVSLAWFRRNEFRLHPSHDCVAGPSFTRPRAATPSRLPLPPPPLIIKRIAVLSYCIFRREDDRDCGGVSTRGHGKRAGPDGDKWSKTTQETLGGSGVSEANGVLRNPYHPHALTKYIEKTD